jgi:TRAP-type uncharacterized transport system substrate-binding protein
MHWFERVRRFAREWVAAIVGVVALAVAAGVYWQSLDRKVYRLSITAGSREGLRYQIATHLASAAAHKRMSLRVVATSGSEESLQEVENGALDLALVQGGLDPRGRDQVRQVAALGIEPLHLLVKAEIAPQSNEVLGLEFLRGRVVNLSERGSGTYQLAREVLEFAGLKSPGSGVPGDYIASTLGYERLLAETNRARLPDAVFTVSALPSPVARSLVTRMNYRIVPLRFGEAFALDAMRTSSGSTPDDTATELHRIDRLHIHNTTIPAYTYELTPPVPAESTPTFGTRLLLVANRNVETKAIMRLLEAGFANGPGGPVLDPALLDLPSEIEWHAGTHLYRESNQPLVLNDLVDFLEKSASLSAIVLGGLFCLWQSYRQRRRRRRDLGFEAYMQRVTSIEQRALEFELSATLDIKQLLALQVELSGLKNEALRRFTSGEIEGEELISGFITQVNDARGYLMRLILHERDNLEDRAETEQRSAEEVWAETVGDLDLDRSPPSERIEER